MTSLLGPSLGRRRPFPSLRPVLSGLLGLVALWSLPSCVRGPDVSSDLPLRRVVIYRNGVAYFERAGEVDEEKVTFKMRGRMVGDFLATLAIVERGGGSVRSASFPIDVKEAEDPDEPDEPPPEIKGMLKPWPRPDEKKKPDPNALRDVVLSLDEGKHDLSIGYVAETPVWRPSYRVVVHPGGQADLQTWGIVQNLSGEDWNDVELVLVAGAPIAFQSNLGTPVIPTRPIVTDTGEVIAAVPTGETTLAEAPAPPPPMAPAPAEGVAYDMAEAEEAREEAAEEPDGDMALRKSKSKKAAAGLGSGAGRGAGMPGAAPAPAKPVAQAPTGFAAGQSVSAPRQMSALAAVALEAGSTRYSLPRRVSVPDESATMVLLLHEKVPGSAVYLFAPDGGVPDSASHPFRVARFTNSTKGLLERGPIAVFEKGSFLGEGMLEPLPPKATATVPFALERGLAVMSESRYEELGARVLRIEASQLFIERDQVRKTVYKVKNGGSDAARLLVKHPRMPGARLHQPPPGTEDNVGTASALVPVGVASYGSAELVVDERSPSQQPVDWLSDLADVALRTYLGDPRSDQKVVSALRSAWAIRDKLRSLTDERHKLRGEQSELERSTNETRASLKVLEKNKQAGDLVAKLMERLRQAGDRLDAITKRLVEVDLALREQEVRFRDAIREVRLEQTPTLAPMEGQPK